MLRRSPMDLQNRAEDLAGTILSAASTPEIAASCSAVESFLRRHASDQGRAFFSAAFPHLVCRLFGFDDSSSDSRPLHSAGWIECPDLGQRLFDLLSPDGILISSISSVDRSATLRYVFPIERLPEWMRLGLQSDRHVPILSDLCPLFRNRVKEDKIQGRCQIQLNVFEYYMFWFAYYPVCRGNCESSDSGVVKKNRRFRLENWTSSLPGLGISGRRSGQKPECSLYLRLLYAYLCAFVPKCGLGSCQPYRSSLLHYSSSCDSLVFNQAEFLVYTLVHFWMVDNDFSPLPVSLCRSFRISFPYRAVLGETPPTAGLGGVLKLLVKYLNCGLVPRTEGEDRRVYAGSPLGKASGMEDAAKSRGIVIPVENAVGSWNSIMQRPLYRFILRSFLFCPVGSSIKNPAQVFSLWVSYMMPWKISSEDFIELETVGIQNSESWRRANLPSSVKSKEVKEGSQVKILYTPVWQGYVLSNYLFYSSLVVHFLGFAHKFLHANLDSTIQMVSQLLNVLTSSYELKDLIHKVDAAYHCKPSGESSSYYDGIYKYVPSIREQFQDWEDGLFESDADGSFIRENLNHDLRLFSDGEDGAHKLLELFVLRAEHEVEAVSGDVSQSLEALHCIRSQMITLFGMGSDPSITHEEAHVLVHGHGHGQLFTPIRPGFAKRKCGDVKYKGDGMRRPISESEVVWLARLMIRFSDWLNESFGFGQVDPTGLGTAYVEVGRDEVKGPKDAVQMVGSWLSSVVRLVRGQRINLRGLASKKFVMLLVVCTVFFWTRFS